MSDHATRTIAAAVAKAAGHVRFQMQYAAASHALEQVLAVARAVGDGIISQQRHEPPEEQFRLALAAARAVLDGLAVELATGEGGDQGGVRDQGDQGPGEAAEGTPWP